MKKIEVAFIDLSIKQAFEKLSKGKFEDEKLYKFILRAINDLKENPYYGIRVPHRLIPKEYIKKYGVQNLWKYNLPGAWRLIYTVQEDRISIVSIILEWMTHKDYERKFGY